MNASRTSDDIARRLAQPGPLTPAANDRAAASDRAAGRREPAVELLARWLDDVFEIPGTNIRFGLDALIGLFPGLGDTLTSIASFYILAAAQRQGVPRITLARMAGNVAIDYVAGAIPLLGDFFDVFWKANRKNVVLLNEFLNATPVAERRSRRGDWLFVGALIVGLVGVLALSVATVWWLIFQIGHLASG